MIAYVVDLEVDAALATEYCAWLKEHVAEMLALPGFLDASILERLDPSLADGRVGFQARYRLRDREAFREYIEVHAPRMRAAGARFGTGVRASRSLFRTLE